MFKTKEKEPIILHSLDQLYRKTAAQTTNNTKTLIIQHTDYLSTPSPNKKIVLLYERNAVDPHVLQKPWKKRMIYLNSQ